MVPSSRQLFHASIRLTFLFLVAVLCTNAAFGQAQSNAADLQGFVRDPSGAVVVGATVSVRNAATNFSREATTNDDGYYQITNLPPGSYEITVEASGFSKGRIPSVTLTVGQRADLDIPLTVGEVGATVDISAAEVSLIESSSTTVSNTIDQTRINNLPINERSATGFALTISTVGRDNGRPIGPAPTSGLNIGGQRGRSTLVQVDGADYTDNSINAARSTVSQEGVQEYQVSTNSYAPEFGRATGGIVNVVTKSGTNDIRGNVFGFIRHKSIQARNPFAPVIDNDPSKRPPFTRAQYGATLGGPLDRDRTFFFTSFEQRRRQESGFFTGNVGAGLTSSITIPVPGLGNQVFTNLSPGQVAFIGGELASGDAGRAGRAILDHVALVGRVEVRDPVERDLPRRDPARDERHEVVELGHECVRGRRHEKLPVHVRQDLAPPVELARGVLGLGNPRQIPLRHVADQDALVPPRHDAADDDHREEHEEDSRPPAPGPQSHRPSACWIGPRPVKPSARAHALV